MSDETRLPEVSDAVELETEEDELEASRKDGVGMLDELIGVIYNRIIETEAKDCKTIDLVRVIDLRYRLSPTSADQIKFWKNLNIVRQKTLKRMENLKNRKKGQERQEPQKKDENVKE